VRKVVIDGEIEESTVVAPRHVDVDVVVPGNEALMPHRSQEGAASETITEAVLLAEGVEVDLLQVDETELVGQMRPVTCQYGSPEPACCDLPCQPTAASEARRIS
jgi:hypothetical protein